jgi:hypothetical protein
LTLLIIYKVHRAENFILRQRNRPALILTNTKITRKPFNSDTYKELEIPVYINDYNLNINAVDLANQFREAYEIQRIGYRTWLPLFYWILNQAVINTYKLTYIKGS